MPRLPASASVVLAGLLPACAAALGLGDIQPKSFLNQPLAAEIPLLTDVPVEVTGLSVTLASPEVFAQFGLPHPSQLTGLNFVVLPGAGGGVIRISSTTPVSEPFLTLLLELRWPQGRLLREFTVLLDPPDFGAAVTPPVTQPPAASPAAAVESGQMQPPESPAEAAPESTAPVAPMPAMNSATSGQTHVVQHSETLWAIAERYRPGKSVGINQMMVSIYRTNPGSFAGNINRLRAGSALQIPDREAIERFGSTEASEEVARQNREWLAEPAVPSVEPARLELVPPQETVPAAPAAATGAAGEDTPATKLNTELEESRRLLAVKDAQLQALQNQLAALQGSTATADVELEAEPAPQPAPQVGAPATTRPAPAPKAARKPATSRPPADTEPGILDSLPGLLTSVWLWIAAAAVLIGALLLSRRRGTGVRTASADDDDDRPAVARRSSAEARTAGVLPVPGAPSMIVHEEPAVARNRRPLLPADEESPLERTIGANSSLDADRADPIAEADFHMAYGLYDQAADLLTAAVGREPERRDLRLKLLDVLFIWENRDGFLREAGALRKRLSDTDPDWKRVVIMGQQLCPDENLFRTHASPAAAEVDLSLAGASSGGSIDFNLGGESEALDFDLDTDPGEGVDTDVRTQITRPGGLGRTQEVPTLELPAAETAVTTEVPTVESSAIASTMETPTVQMPAGAGTLETPTLESWGPGAGATARMPAAAGFQEGSGETAEIELEDLGLDLSGFDVEEIARDMGTGLQEALPDASATGLDIEFNETDIRTEAEESTAEMIKDPSLSHMTLAMDKDSGAEDSDRLINNTIEQPVSDLTVTGLRSFGGQRLPEDQTMTEVGTKLDLARAYVDMGDPEGARSILHEVIEEGDQAQRQEAHQLLDSLDH